MIVIIISGTEINPPKAHVNSHHLSSILALIHTPPTTSLSSHTVPGGTHHQAPGACSPLHFLLQSADDDEFFQQQQGLSSGAATAASGAPPPELVSSCVVHGADERCRRGCRQRPTGGSADAGVTAVNEPAEGRAGAAANAGRRPEDAIQAGRGELRPEDTQIRLEPDPEQMRYTHTRTL